MLFIIANDQLGLERAVRLFPIRTGLALADWLVIGNRADNQGASGIEKAGYVNSSNLWRSDRHLKHFTIYRLWGCSWEYHSGMSWQH